MNLINDFPLSDFPSDDFKYGLKLFLTWVVLTVAALLSLSMIGCSHAGPYVTRLTPTFDGLEVEKCYVDFFYITGNVATGKCTVDQIKIGEK